MRALQIMPTVSNAQDFKAPVDAAQTALKVFKMLEREKQKAEEVASRKRMFEALETIETRIRDAGSDGASQVYGLTGADRSYNRLQTRAQL